MAPSRNYTIGLKVAVTVVFIFHLAFLPLKSAHGSILSSNSESRLRQKKKMVLGSRPPVCVNKCLNCRPCLATLVVPSHQKKGLTYKASSFHIDDQGDDDHGYYLLSWKCRCGDKLFQP